MNDRTRNVWIYCSRCDEHHVARAMARDDDTEWVVECGESRAALLAPVSGAAARHPIVLQAVSARLEQALHARRGSAERESDARSARREEAPRLMQA